MRDYNGLKQIFKKYNSDIDLIIHTAAQPSHDWALNDPILDFGINANGTLNLLQLTKLHSKMQYLFLRLQIRFMETRQTSYLLSS